MSINLGLDTISKIAKTDPYFWGMISSSNSYFDLSRAYHIYITFPILEFAEIAVSAIIFSAQVASEALG